MRFLFVYNSSEFAHFRELYLPYKFNLLSPNSCHYAKTKDSFIFSFKNKDDFIRNAM